MVKSLRIPVFLQPKIGPYCGPTCMKMILSYYGIGLTLKEIVRELPMTESGIDLCSMGIFLRNFTDVIVFINRDSLDGGNAIYEQTIPPFRKARGLLSLRSVQLPDMKLALNMGCPIILNIKSLRKADSGHYVVVRHIGKRRITVNDPGYGQRTFSIDRIVSSCHDWSGGALILMPPNDKPRKL